MYAIESDDTRCIIGHYGPFDTLEEATRHFKFVTDHDTTARLVYKTKDELNARSDVIMATRSRDASHSSQPPTFNTASPFDAVAYGRLPTESVQSRRGAPAIRVRDDTGKSTRKAAYGTTIEEQQ